MFDHEKENYLKGISPSSISDRKYTDKKVSRMNQFRWRNMLGLDIKI